MGAVLEMMAMAKNTMMKLGLGIALALGLSACGTMKQTDMGQDLAKSYLSKWKSSDNKINRMPPDLLIQARDKAPMLLATIEKHNVQGVLFEWRRNKDVISWEALDDITLSWRDGVVVRTSGLVSDLSAATTPSVSQLLAQGSYQRQYVLLDGNDQSQTLTFACRSKVVGQPQIQILDMRYATRQVTEQCDDAKGQGLSIANDYWIEGAGRIRKSRQWISPFVGYLVLEDLRR